MWSADEFVAKMAAKNLAKSSVLAVTRQRALRCSKRIQERIVADHVYLPLEELTSAIAISPLRIVATCTRQKCGVMADFMAHQQRDRQLRRTLRGAAASASAWRHHARVTPDSSIIMPIIQHYNNTLFI
ncbi:hypothetical protein X777_13340 [Ooceraea biroi]|uniref:Uncharacterized protein n=1 Tax=Ooceraea biroi TaxID=2015173 RepID=A0A026WW50_OOCBI|nr:hypothetical protein X777_13340 [Ooceraea biroi]